MTNKHIYSLLLCRVFYYLLSRQKKITYAHVYFVAVTCKALNIENGYVEYNNNAINGRYVFHTVATYKCNSGYNRVGSLFRTCVSYNHGTVPNQDATRVMN